MNIYPLDPAQRALGPLGGVGVIVTRPQRPLVVIKVGTLDEPSQMMPQVAIYTVDKQPFHMIPEGLPAFERLPQR